MLTARLRSMLRSYVDTTTSYVSLYACCIPMHFPDSVLHTRHFWTMADEDLGANCWGAFLPDSEFHSEIFQAPKKYPCKFEDCKRSFTHSQSRSRHYRNDHAPITDLSVASVCDDLTANRTDSNLSETGISTKLEVADVIDWCQSIFNSESTETAIPMIKGSRIVQEKAVEMRYACHKI